jgi:SsrA-binding protein
MGEKVVAVNRRARHDYHVLETFEAGIALRGTEVKSLRAGHMTLKDSYADARDGELYLVGAHISPYEQGSVFNHDPERARKLLMHKREILRLIGQVQEKGLTLIPLKVYFKRGKAKVELGLCRGKHRGDKREAIKEREIKRELDQQLKAAKKGR